MEKGSLHNIYFIAAVDTKDISSMRGSRAYEAMTSYHTGIQLGGNAMVALYCSVKGSRSSKQSVAVLGMVVSMVFLLRVVKIIIMILMF